MFVKKQIDSLKESWGGGVPILSAILLERESFTTDSFLKQMAKTCVRGKAVSGIKPEKEGVFSFQVGDEFFAFLHISTPYPDDLKAPSPPHGCGPESYLSKASNSIVHFCRSR